MPQAVSSITVLVLAVAMVTLALLHMHARRSGRARRRTMTTEVGPMRPAGPAGYVRALRSPLKSIPLCSRCAPMQMGRTKMFICLMNERCGLQENVGTEARSST